MNETESRAPAVRSEPLPRDMEASPTRSQVTPAGGVGQAVAGGRITRLPDWEARMNRAIDALRDTPFQWGRADCVLAVVDIVLAMTGSDIAGEYRGRYTEQRGAYRLLGKYAGAGLEAAAAKRFRELAAPEIVVALARRGDVLLFDGAAEPSLAICIGQHAAAMGEAGLLFIPALDCRRAWRIG